MISDTLKQLDAWYNEPSEGGHRPKLLSKLAILELCGWIESELDRIVLVVEAGRLNDPAWVQENVISKTYGFGYAEHWRPMFSKLVGELFARRIEAEMEKTFPGELERMKSQLGTLWRIRCSLAHSHITATVSPQQTLNAPSWAINQHRVLEKLMTSYEQATATVLASV